MLSGGVCLASNTYVVHVLDMPTDLTIPITDVRSQMAELVNRVAYGGDHDDALDEPVASGVLPLALPEPRISERVFAHCDQRGDPPSWSRRSFPPLWLPRSAACYPISERSPAGEG